MNPNGTNRHALTDDHSSYNPDCEVGTIGQGDVNCSGAVNSVDALKVLRHVAGFVGSAD